MRQMASRRHAASGALASYSPAKREEWLFALKQELRASCRFGLQLLDDHPPSVLKQGQGPEGTETHWVRVSLTCFGSTGGQRVVTYRPRDALPEKPNQIASKPPYPTDLWLSITGPAPGFACPNSAMAAEYSSRHTKAPNTAHRPYGCVRPLPETFSPALYTFHAAEVPPSL